MKKAATVVFGMGSVLMGDEGIGVYLVRELEKQKQDFPGTEFIEMGVAGFKVLHHLKERRKAVFIDCAFMDEVPGTMRRFTPGEVESRLQTPGISNHAADLLKLITISGRLGEAPAETVFFGIQPEVVSRQEGLSLCLRSHWQSYLGQISKELKGISDHA